MRNFILVLCFIAAGCYHNAFNPGSSRTLSEEEGAQAKMVESSILVDEKARNINMLGVQISIPDDWQVTKKSAALRVRTEKGKLFSRSFDPAIRLRSKTLPDVDLLVTVTKDAWKANRNRRACKFSGAPMSCEWEEDTLTIMYLDILNASRTIYDGWIVRGDMTVTIRVRSKPGTEKKLKEILLKFIEGVTLPLENT